MKKVQILIIVLVSILTITCATFAVLYFATDIFKSDKDLFCKYSGQIDLKEFIDLGSYNNYLKRLESEGHGNEGEFTINLAQGEETITESIKYTGYSDPVNKKSSYEISINKDSEELLAMNYLKDKDLYGLQFKDVVNQYIVLENNNLKEFASKLGIENTDKVPDRIENTKTSEYLNYEEVNKILNKYLNVAMQTIPEDNYSKIEKSNISLGDKTVEADGYQIKLKAKDIQKIFTKILETAREDEQIFNLINKLNSEDIIFEDYQNNIDEILSEVSGEISSEENVDSMNISVYKQGKHTVKLSLNILAEEDNNIEISLDKTSKGLVLKYTNIDKSYETENEMNIFITKTGNSQEQESFECNIVVKAGGEETGNYNITLSRTGALTSNNVAFGILIPITSDDGNLNIEFKSTANFSATPESEEFTEDNHLVINEVSVEQLSNLFTNLGNKIADKLKDEMFVSMMNDMMSRRMGLFQTAQRAVEETQKQEIQLQTGEIEVNGQTYNNMEEYSSEMQDTDEQVGYTPDDFR